MERRLLSSIVAACGVAVFFFVCLSIRSSQRPVVNNGNGRAYISGIVSSNIKAPKKQKRGRHDKKKRHDRPSNHESSKGSISALDTEETTAAPPNSSNVTLANGDEDKSWPQVAWLMSFPNSGTSYTLALVRTVSQRNTARNDGEGDYDKHGNSISVLPDSPAGPFLNHPEKKHVLALPDSYILTKTHCGGRCYHCGPGKFLETPSSFERQCLRTKKSVGTTSAASSFKGTDTRRIVKETYYDKDIVKRAIHLMRNPFNNVVARYHLEQKNIIKRNEGDDVNKDVSDADGFQARCRELDSEYSPPPLENEDTAAAAGGPSYEIDHKIRKLFKDVPCHDEFFKYVQWHNYAFATTDGMNVPVHVLHYEDFGEKFDETLSDVMGFLKLDPVSTPRVFVKGKDYVDYYTDSQRKAIKRLVEELSTEQTWENLRYYFE